MRQWAPGCGCCCTCSDHPCRNTLLDSMDIVLKGNASATGGDDYYTVGLSSSLCGLLVDAPEAALFDCLTDWYPNSISSPRTCPYSSNQFQVSGRVRFEVTHDGPPFTHILVLTVTIQKFPLALGPNGVPLPGQAVTVRSEIDVTDYTCEQLTSTIEFTSGFPLTTPSDWGCSITITSADVTFNV
jgi:hypothetical protein